MGAFGSRYTDARSRVAELGFVGELFTELSFSGDDRKTLMEFYFRSEEC